jgi:hypothetical protein
MGTCFRAGCNHGTKPLGARGAAIPKKLGKVYPGQYSWLPYNSIEAEFIRNQYGIDRQVAWDDEVGRYILHIRGPEGHADVRGVQAYGFDKDPKCLSYQEKINEPWIHYARPSCGFNRAVIVEDWFSAEKVGQARALGVALLGTQLNLERVVEIKRAAGDKPCILALDRDAYPKAIKLAAEYGQLFDPSLRVWRLDRDLKYVSVSTIQKALNDDRTNDIGSYAQQPGVL